MLPACRKTYESESVGKWAARVRKGGREADRDGGKREGKMEVKGRKSAREDGKKKRKRRGKKKEEKRGRGRETRKSVEIDCMCVWDRESEKVKRKKYTYVFWPHAHTEAIFIQGFELCSQRLFSNFA